MHNYLVTLKFGDLVRYYELLNYIKSYSYDECKHAILENKCVKVGTYNLQIKKPEWGS